MTRSIATVSIGGALDEKLRTIAAARQKEMKLSMAVVATRTLATGRAAADVLVRRGLELIRLREGPLYGTL